MGLRNELNIKLSLDGGIYFSITSPTNIHVLDAPLILSSILNLATEVGHHDILYLELSVDFLSLTLEYLGCTVSI